MPLLGNRIRETTATTGTGTISLGGAVAGFQAFSGLAGIVSGNTVYYLIVDNPDNPVSWECGVGTWTTGSPATLSRDTVEESSAADAKVSWAAGTKTVICAATAASLGGKGPAYGARAWVRFNGTGTPAILDSRNVSSIGDNGVGNYSVNWVASTFPNANYAPNANGALGGNRVLCDFASAAGIAASTLNVITSNAGTLVDADAVCVAAHGT